MFNKSKSSFRILLSAAILLTSLVSAVGVGYADDSPEELVVIGTTDVQCGTVDFSFNWSGGTPPYLVQLIYGDGDNSLIETVSDPTITFNYTYLDQGDYEWTIRVEEVDELTGLGTGVTGFLSEILTLEGPEVTLISDPPVALFVMGDPGEVAFSTEVTGDPLDYTYAWDLDGDGTFDGETGITASYAYTEAGKHLPKVMITDGCGFTASDTIPVVVSNPGDACQPTAQKIADAVNTIFPDQAGDLYTCEDIYGIFEGDPEGSNTGFGLMWKAYNLALDMEDLTWEDIMDWKLAQSGWGALLQLDRYAELLDEHSLPDLMGLVMSEEYSLGDVRTAARSVTRYEADFEDALTRIAEGATTGELGQFYKLAADLEADPALLDGYLADGLSLSELKHTSNLAERMEVDWTEVADARSDAESWGDINQAYRLATADTSAAEILINGIKEYRETLKEEDVAVREAKQEEQKGDKDEQTAEKLAEQYSAEAGDIMNLLNGECEGDWACVRSELREQERTMADGPSEKDLQTALQIGAKYGYSDAAVLDYHNESCDADWACTRTYFRENTLIIKETGKPEK